MFVKLLILQLFLSSNCLFGKKKYGSEAEQLLLSYKDDYFWTIISNADGTHIASRACFLQFKPDLGFHIIAKNHTKKYEQLKANPYVTLSLAKIKDHNIPAFYATVRVSTDKSDISKAWFNGLKEYGYTGKDDPRLVVFVFTIHGATLGAKKYEGEAYDYPSLNVVGDAPLPPLPVGPYQSAEGLSVLANAWKKDPNFHLLTRSGLKIHDRLMQLNYNNKTGFYFVTTATSDKVTQLAGNPNIALLHEDRNEKAQVVVDGLLLPIKCNKSKEGSWNESFKPYGYSGWEDPNYAVYKLVVRKIIVHSLKEDPKTYQFEPTAYDNATALLYSAAQAKSQWSFATVDERNEPHSRTMLLNYHSSLGFWLGGNNASNKYKELAYKSSGALNAYIDASGDDYQVQVSARVLNCDPVRQAIKSAKLKSIGSTDKSQDQFRDKKTLAEFLPIILSVRSLKHLPPKTANLPPTVYQICKTNATGAGAEDVVKPGEAPVAVDVGTCVKDGDGKGCGDGAKQDDSKKKEPEAKKKEPEAKKEEVEKGEKGKKKKKGDDTPAPPPPAAEAEKKAEEKKAEDKPAAPPPPAETDKKGKKKK